METIIYNDRKLSRMKMNAVIAEREGMAYTAAYGDKI